MKEFKELFSTTVVIVVALFVYHFQTTRFKKRISFYSNTAEKKRRDEEVLKMFKSKKYRTSRSNLYLNLDKTLQVLFSTLKKLRKKLKGIQTAWTDYLSEV